MMYTIRSMLRCLSLYTSLPIRGLSTPNSKTSRRHLRFIFPEFLPDPDISFRNLTRERIERKDMLRRRMQVEIPEFYVGSILAVTVTDPHVTAACNVPTETRFVGIVIDRGGCGLRAWIIVRNVIEGQGIEIMYYIYSPTIVKIETLRLEKRLDEELYYLRDADPKYSTFPLDMDQEILPEGTRVPINDMVVPLKDPPWLRRWERLTQRMKGFKIPCELKESQVKRFERYMAVKNPGWQMETVPNDLMNTYRITIPIEEQDAIWLEVGEALERRDVAIRKVASKRAFSKPNKRN